MSMAVLCCMIGVLILSVEVFLSTLMYTVVVLYHGNDYWLFMLLRG